MFAVVLRPSRWRKLPGGAECDTSAGAAATCGTVGHRRARVARRQPAGPSRRREGLGGRVQAELSGPIGVSDMAEPKERPPYHGHVHQARERRRVGRVMPSSRVGTPAFGCLPVAFSPQANGATHTVPNKSRGTKKRRIVRQLRIVGRYA
jgi:hypothetical protein